MTWLIACSQLLCVNSLTQNHNAFTFTPPDTFDNGNTNSNSFNTNLYY